jgi:alpha-beta hydrolase superfamily lysophospholipase
LLRSSVFRLQPISIYTQVFVPKSGKAEAILFVSHGRNEYTDKYHQALFKDGTLDDKNWIVVIIDTRGQGASSGFWNYFPSFADSACDMGHVMDKFADLVEIIPAFWFCHSTG